MSRRYQDPVETLSARGSLSTHPAYGIISAGRVNGTASLFGSDFMHHNFISLTISAAELHRDLSHDWVYPKGSLIEIWMSEAQWATFVSSLNVGQGVSCTLRRTEKDDDIPEIPVRETSLEFKKEAGKTLQECVVRVDRATDQVRNGCVECGEEFHLDDTGGYNPPCSCGSGLCRHCCDECGRRPSDDEDDDYPDEQFPATEAQ